MFSRQENIRCVYCNPQRNSQKYEDITKKFIEVEYYKFSNNPKAQKKEEKWNFRKRRDNKRMDIQQPNKYIHFTWSRTFGSRLVE